MDNTLTHTSNISSRVIQENLVWHLNNMFETNGINGVKWIPESDGYYNHADYVFSSSGNFDTIIPISGSQSHTRCIPYKDGASYVNYDPMVGEYPVDFANGLSNIRLYCYIVKSKTTPLLVSIPTTRWTVCTRTTSTRIECWYLVPNCWIESSMNWRKRTTTHSRSSVICTCWSVVVRYWRVLHENMWPPF